jgi:hypothetical protein
MNISMFAGNVNGDTNMSSNESVSSNSSSKGKRKIT